ncbi:hypothetical protein SAMN06309944_1325 [Micrococcales bacterium KH10]|nr:hypothetical protein SAMN06309944_1325 [Micrococcales bacterium KH10]
MTFRHKFAAVITAAVTLVATGFLAAPANATQTKTEYCGTAGIYGTWEAWNNQSTKKAGSRHATGPLCSYYKVRIRYEVPTTGTRYWATWATNTAGNYAVTQNSPSGYPLIKAEHRVVKNGSVYTVTTI